MSKVKCLGNLLVRCDETGRRGAQLDDPSKDAVDPDGLDDRDSNDQDASNVAVSGESLSVGGSRKDELWRRLAEVCVGEGVVVYDLEIPAGVGGVIRLYIASKSAHRDPVSMSECVRVGKKVMRLPDFLELIPAPQVLEVSSPGINRRLVSAEHFKEALGERVKVSYFDSLSPESLNLEKEVVGVLKSFDGNALVIGDERSKEDVRVLLQSMRRARIDFLFSAV